MSTLLFNFHLFVIDGQNDFHDLPETYLPRNLFWKPGEDELIRPALAVDGSHLDMLRLLESAERGMSALDALTVSLDAHNYYGIERSSFWVQGDGTEVSAFTQITLRSVVLGAYLPRDRRLVQAVLAYLTALEKAGRTLMVWTTHCPIGGWGMGLHPNFARFVQAWEGEHLQIARKVLKGSNPMTEHHSALAAHVPDPEDLSTQMNWGLVRRIGAARITYFAGQAGSHCVPDTLDDVVAGVRSEFGGDFDMARLAVVTDAMSAVKGFDAEMKAFFVRMKAAGVRLITCEEMGNELAAAS
ncbi:cysteine hydrolase [Ottowia sp.]|uniref:cysteine hydrolase n=1 Tax=Ottowia sp. TaxID=1898956 RepID=UPI0025EF1A84|nr:cysteine hydrolase [Ottowia sp.]MBK6616422.1 cysteine hydrolase [Ottowia sp.]